MIDKWHSQCIKENSVKKVLYLQTLQTFPFFTLSIFWLNCIFLPFLRLINKFLLIDDREWKYTILSFNFFILFFFSSILNKNQLINYLQTTLTRIISHEKHDENQKKTKPKKKCLQNNPENDPESTALERDCRSILQLLHMHVCEQYMEKFTMTSMMPGGYNFDFAFELWNVTCKIVD